MTRLRTYDIPEDAFRETVANSVSLRAVIRNLDLHDHSNTYRRLRQRISELQIDTSHFGANGRRTRRYTDDQLTVAVAKSRSLRQTLLSLGIRPEGGNYRTIRREIKRLNLCTSHFTGMGWRKGQSTPVTPPLPLSRVLVEDSPVSTSHVRKRLLRHGVKEHRCELCKLTRWRDRAIPLELDHINGVNDDHRLENLRVVCPNCHAQTDTYRARNAKRSRSRDEET